MSAIDHTIAGQVYACGAHGSGYIGYHEMDRAEAEAAPGEAAEMVLQPYMARVG